MQQGNRENSPKNRKNPPKQTWHEKCYNTVMKTPSEKKMDERCKP